MIGGISGGIQALKHDGNFWNGKGATFDALALPGDHQVGEGMEYTNEYAQKFSDDYYGKKIKGLNKLHADGSLPPGYKVNANGVINKDGQYVRGITRYIGKGKSNVYLVKAAFTSKEQLYFTMGHEYMHVAYNNAGTDFRVNKANAQHAAISKWEYQQARLWGFKVSEYRAAYNRYNPQSGIPNLMYLNLDFFYLI